MSTEIMSDRSARTVAQLAVVCPLFAWVSQFAVVVFLPRLSGEVYLLIAILQGLLILGGIGFGIVALVTRRPEQRGVLVQAVLGILISAATILLIAYFAYGSLSAET